MARRPKTESKQEVRRLTVSLPSADYDRLLALAESTEPPLSLSFVAQYAIHDFLEKSRNPKFVLQSGTQDNNVDQKQ